MTDAMIRQTAPPPPPEPSLLRPRFASLLCGSDGRGPIWAVYDFVEKVLSADSSAFQTDDKPARY